MFRASGDAFKHSPVPDRDYDVIILKPYCFGIHVLWKDSHEHVKCVNYLFSYAELLYTSRPEAHTLRGTNWAIYMTAYYIIY